MQAMFYIALLCNLNNLEKNERKQLKEQITRKLENISKCKIQSSKTWEEHYNNLKEHTHNHNYNVISILKYVKVLLTRLKLVACLVSLTLTK